MTLVAQALAAIGTRPTIHVVLAYRGGPQLVDLKTGRTSTMAARVEVWADPKLGALMIWSLDGRMIKQYRTRTSRVARPLAMWRGFVSGYRAQLRNGSYHVIGHGTLDGQPVEWIAGPPTSIPIQGTETEEVAISLATHKPLLVRWRRNGHVIPNTSARILAAETLPRGAALFAHHPTVSSGYTVLPNSGTGLRTTLRRARATMNPDPIIPPLRIANLNRAWVGEPEMLIAPGNSYRDRVPGVTFYYGHLDQYGLSSYRGSFIAITEVADPGYAHALQGPASSAPAKPSSASSASARPPPT